MPTLVLEVAREQNFLPEHTDKVCGGRTLMELSLSVERCSHCVRVYSEGCWGAKGVNILTMFPDSCFCISIRDQVKTRSQRAKDLLIHLTVVKTEQSRSGKQPKDVLLQAVPPFIFLYLLSATHA